MPSAGFPVSQLIVRLMVKKPGAVYRNKSVDKLNASLGRLQCSVDNLVRLFSAKSKHTVRDYCDSLRRDVHLAAESAHHAIDQHRDQLAAHIDSYEQACLNAQALVVRERHEQVELAKSECDRFVSETTRYLSQFSIDDECVSGALERAEQLTSQLDIEALELKARMFNGKRLVFNAAAALDTANATRLGEWSYELLQVPALVTDLEHDMQQVDLKQSVLDIDATIHSAYALDDKFVVFYKDKHGYLSVSHSNDADADWTHHYIYTDVGRYITNGYTFHSCKHATGTARLFCFVKYEVAYVGTQMKLRSFDSSLNRIEISAISQELAALACNATHLFGAQDASTVHVYAQETLEFVKTIAIVSSSSPSEQVRQLVACDERLFVLDAQRRLTVVNVKSEAVERQIALDQENFVYHLDKFIVSLDAEAKKLVWYETSGCKYEKYLQNCTHDTSIVDSVGDSLVFLDAKTLTLKHQLKLQIK